MSDSYLNTPHPCAQHRAHPRAKCSVNICWKNEREELGSTPILRQHLGQEQRWGSSTYLVFLSYATAGDHYKVAKSQQSDHRSLLQMASVTDGKTGIKDASDQNFDYMFKLLIIGNSSVGKTSFLFRYADDTFTPAFVSTVGIDFKVKTVYRHEKRVKLQIWVSAGHRGQNEIELAISTRSRRWNWFVTSGSSGYRCHFRSGHPLPHIYFTCLFSSGAHLLLLNCPKYFILAFIEKWPRTQMWGLQTLILLLPLISHGNTTKLFNPLDHPFLQRRLQSHQITLCCFWVIVLVP